MLSEHWTNSTRSSRTAFFGTFVLIGIIAVYNWIIAPHRNYLQAAQRYESAMTNLASKNDIISSQVTLKKKELKELKEKYKLSYSRLFNPVEAEEFFSNIQTKSAQVNCILSSVTFSPVRSAPKTTRPQTDGYITAQSATLSLSGGYENILALMDKLQDSTKQVRIDSFGINSDQQDSASLECGMTVTIYVIHRKEEYRND
jgi:Tfp pilus assembly protein PilO